MNFKKTLSSTHLAGTVWFMLCTGYIFILAMIQAGFNWLVIFSLSGYLAFLVTLLVILYLFAIFRGADSGPTMQNEHPLTGTMYYMAFYVSTPFLGAIAGMLGMIGSLREMSINSLLSGIAMGTIGATFLTWIVVDSIAGSVELLTPQARRYRIQRLEQAKQHKQQEQADREQLLARVFEQEKENTRLWQEALTPQADRLAKLLACDDATFSSARQEAVELGVEAWRMGGLNCMRRLRDVAMDNFKRQYNQREFVDYISAWWDGIGSWRNPSLVSG